MYTQSDTMQSLIDWEAIMPMPRYAGGHDEQMQGLFKGTRVIGHYNEGGYDGQVATACVLEDGRCAIYNDYFGSCSGCDAWEGASDGDVRKLCIDLANSAYVFESSDGAVSWLEQVADGTIKPDGYSWRNVAGCLLKAIKETT